MEPIDRRHRIDRIREGQRCPALAARIPIGDAKGTRLRKFSRHDPQLEPVRIEREREHIEATAEIQRVESRAVRRRAGLNADGKRRGTGAPAQGENPALG